MMGKTTKAANVRNIDKIYGMFIDHFTVSVFFKNGTEVTIN